MIRILGFCASPREGNSAYILRQAMAEAEAVSKAAGEVTVTDYVTIRGKKISGCVMCQRCMKDGVCIIRDDFSQLQEAWMAADVVLYSVPVYQMGMPSQMKAFVDRLGNSMFGQFKKLFGEDITSVPRPLKVVGCISQGIHAFSGQEHTITQVINHAMICGCIPVTGDMWECYIGAGGWTRNMEDRNALENLVKEGEFDAGVLAQGTKSLARRAVELRIMLQRGAKNCKNILEDPTYIALSSRLEEELDNT